METSASFEARYAPLPYPTNQVPKPAFFACPNPGAPLRLLKMTSEGRMQVEIGTTLGEIPQEVNDHGSN
jgi:hypothetical protein